MANELPSWDDTEEVKSDLPSWDDTEDISVEPKAVEAAPKESDPSMVESGLGGLKQGASFGFSDELGGGLEALGSMVGIEGLGGNLSDLGFEKPVWLDKERTIGDEYRSARDRRRNYNKELREANPGSFLTGELASMVVPGAGGAKAISKIPALAKLAQGGKASQILGKSLTGAGAGAIEGTLGGFGASEGDLSKQLGDAVTGGALGAGLGGTLPVGIEAIKGAGKGIKNLGAFGLEQASGTKKKDWSELQDAYRSGDELPDVGGDYREGIRPIKNKLKSGVRNMVRKQMELGKKRKEILLDEDFDTKAGDLKRAVKEEYANIVENDKYMAADKKNAVKSEVKKILPFFSGVEERNIQLNLKKNELDKNLQKLEMAHKDIDMDEMAEKYMSIEGAKEQIAAINEQWGGFHKHINKITGKYLSLEDIPKAKRAKYHKNRRKMDELLGTKGFGSSAESEKYVQNLDSEAMLYQQAEDAFAKKRELKDLLDGYAEDEKRINKYVYDKQKLTAERDMIAGELEALSNSLDDVRTGTDIGKKVRELQGDVKKFKSERQEPVTGASLYSASPKETFVENLQRRLNNQFLKGDDPNIPFSSPAKEEYSGVMKKMATIEDVRAGMKKIFSNADSIESKLMKIAKGLSDPDDKRSLADILQNFDKNAQTDIYKALEYYNLLDKFSGRGFSQAPGSRAGLIGQTLSAIIAPTIKKTIKGKVAAEKTIGRSWAGEVLKSGKFNKFGNYAGQFSDALRTKGLPGVVALEYTLSQQDPEFAKKIQER